MASLLEIFATKKREIFVVKNSHQDFRESFMGTRHDFLTQWPWLDHLNVVSPILNQIRHLPFVTALISLISWLNSTAFSVVRSNRKCDPTRVNGVEQLNKSWWWCGLTSCSQSQYVYIYIIIIIIITIINYTILYNHLHIIYILYIILSWNKKPTLMRISAVFTKEQPLSVLTVSR